MFRVFFRLALCIAFAALSVGGSHAQDTPLRPYVGQLRTIQIEIDGHQATLLFDTGAAISSITPAFADELGCTAYGHVTAFRMDGQRVTFQRCRPLDTTVANVRTHHEFGVFDLDAVLPPDLPRLQGIAGLDLFDGRILTIRRGLNAIRVETPQSLARSIGRRRPALLHLGREAGGIGLTAFVRAPTRVGDAWLLLDSANLAGTRLHPWARSALANGAGPLLLSVEGAQSREVEPQVVDDLIYDGALDARFITAQTITLDLARGRIWWRDDQ